MSVMEVEGYLLEDFCADAEGLRALVREEEPLDLRTQAAIRLGFARPMPMRKTRPVADEAAKYFPEWKGFRLRAWSTYLGTHYPQNAWHRYKFDEPPLRVLNAIEAALDAGIFEEVEIWTPEPQPERTFREALRTKRRQVVHKMRELVDPVAVGIVDGRYFPIVRWGEEELLAESYVMRVGGFRAVRKHILGPPRHRGGYMAD